MKDLIAHFMLWEQWVLDRCEQLMQSGKISDERDTRPTDEMNQLHYERNQFRPLAEVRHEERAVFTHILGMVQAFNEEALFAPDKYEFAPGIALADEIENETVGHYRAHSAAIANFSGNE